MASKQIHEYLERLGNLMRNEARLQCSRYGLQPVQLDALHYLDMCNHYSDTPQGVTEFLGLTKGTVSQSLKVLEGKGLLKKTADPNDRRSVHLKLTAKGRRLVDDSVPAPTLEQAWSDISKDQQQQLGAGLKALLNSIQQRNRLKSFGVCKTCRHNRKLSADEHFCQLTEETLSIADIELICREHEHVA